MIGVFTILIAGILGGDLRANPPEIVLDGPNARATLLIESQDGDRIRDLTSEVQLEIEDPTIASLGSNGQFQAIRDGSSSVIARWEGSEVRVPIEVRNSKAPREFHFENDIMPILSRFGCNTSGCHGKAEGQNGFKLSVFGFDPEADYKALSQEGRGRRIFPSAPGKSLFLTKASGGVPHGGGVRISSKSLEYQTLYQWIGAGQPRGNPDAPKVERVEVTPRERDLALKGSQQIRVVATWTDGRKTDVTPLAKFQTNNEALGTVDERGLVRVGETPGQMAVMAAYQGSVDVFQVLIPRPEKLPTEMVFAEAGDLDRLVNDRLRRLNIAPSPRCVDEEYIRRVFIDVIGTLPTSTEVRAFLKDTRPEKRRLLVEALLQRPEFETYWALKWSDWLRVDRLALGREKAYRYYRWIREEIAANRPWDQFVRKVIAAEGPLHEQPAGYFYGVPKDPGATASLVSQVFLGVRIECAQCHHHPFDRWGQSDYLAMKDFFVPVRLSDSKRGSILLANPSEIPIKDGKPSARALGSIEEVPAGEDPRRYLANWMTNRDNPWFSRNFANRIWAHFLGRGLIEPVDDIRLTNPPSNPALLDRLGDRFAGSGYDFRLLILDITASETYQRSVTPNATNERDEQNYSRALFRRMDAEVLLDGISQVTGVAERFEGAPDATRAIELWDSQVPHYFLRLFGRPVRLTACSCERVTEPSVAQVLHVMNSPRIQEKLSHAGGTISNWVASGKSSPEIVEELYLSVFSRYPSPEEAKAALDFLNSTGGSRESLEDLVWSLLNTVEFLFNH